MLTIDLVRMTTERRGVLVLWLSSVGPPSRQISITTITSGHILILLGFWYEGELRRNICFTKRPKELYRAFTRVLNKKWKGEKIEFTGDGYKGSIEKIYKTDVLLVIEISPPYALRCELGLDLQEVNAIQNQMGILIDE